jgi:hypothetical protein
MLMEGRDAFREDDASNPNFENPAGNAERIVSLITSVTVPSAVASIVTVAQ